MSSEQRVLIGYLLAVCIIITVFAFPIASSKCHDEGSCGNSWSSSNINNVHSNLSFYVGSLVTISGFSNQVSED